MIFGLDLGMNWHAMYVRRDPVYGVDLKLFLTKSARTFGSLV